VIILDHNITEDQADLLRKWKIRFRKIGVEVGRPEWEDRQEILRYLHQAKQATFFSRDFDFFNAELCHSNYALVTIAAPNKKRLLSSEDFCVIRNSKPRRRVVAKSSDCRHA